MYLPILNIHQVCSVHVPVEGCSNYAWNIEDVAMHLGLVITQWSLCAQESSDTQTKPRWLIFIAHQLYYYAHKT